MKKLIYLLAFINLFQLRAQDTFSIVAVDSLTGEVGSAGASCVNLFSTPFSNDDFLGQLLPGVGAINTQAYYLTSNQNVAFNQLKAGKTPDQIIQHMISNDAQSQPQFRQYGIVALINGKPVSAAYTGSQTDPYKGHLTGPNYAIQGNILLGPEILENMQKKFLEAQGDLSCKLMAALQGANTIGADTRCTSNKTSSLFAFVKVAKKTDEINKPSFLVSVRTRSGDKIEPIDSLQKKFNKLKSCTTAVKDIPDFEFDIYPVPGSNLLNVKLNEEVSSFIRYELISIEGKIIESGKLNEERSLNISKLLNGSYILRLIQGNKMGARSFYVD